VERPFEDELRDLVYISAERALVAGRHVAVLQEEVVDVPVLPPGAPADDVVPADVGADELPKLCLPLQLQPR
jgi:hypothetical protein